MNINPPPPGIPLVLSAQPPVAKPVNRWRWWIHLLLLGSYIILVGILGQEQSAHRHVLALSHTPGGLLIVCTSGLCLFFLVLGLAVKVSRASCDDLWLRWRRGLWPVAIGVVYSVALRFAISTIVSWVSLALILSEVMTPQSVQDFFASNRPSLEKLVDISAMRENSLYFWLCLTVVSFVVAGLREELWRSAFLAGLRTLWPRRFDTPPGRVVAVALAAILFAFAHLGMGLLTILIAGGLGFALGLIMVFHRSIWPAVITHGMFDATSLALLPRLIETFHQFQPPLGH